MPPPVFQPSPTRRRIAYSLVAILILLVLAVTPPLLNVSRYRRRIVTALGQSLNRPVHIDDVSLRLLPLPGLTFRNFVVSEDAAFGDEPTIRANTVVATLRLSSLWRRRVEFSTVSFTEPSLNLVRNREGRWNLDSILMQAAHVPSAPTAQRHAGAAPRFPYIEATGARINLKLGDEKTPFSLTDADFALWLPESDQWRVRLRGRPVRTDTHGTDVGLLRVEGSLRRASGVAAVPVDFAVNWSDAQLGETTRLLSGRDMGWRGTASGSATLQGPLSAAQVAATLHLRELRRADFVPAQLLDVDVTCQAGMAVTTAVLRRAICQLPAPAPAPRDLSGAALGDAAGSAAAAHELGGVQPWGVQLRAESFDLTSRTPVAMGLSLRASNTWLTDWARLLSARLAPDFSPAGWMQGQLSWIPASPPAAAFWQGTLVERIPAPEPRSGSADGPPDAGSPAAPPPVSVPIVAGPDGFILAPVDLFRLAQVPASVSGNVSAQGYRLQLSGAATPAQVVHLAQVWPPLLSGLETVFPAASPAGPGARPSPLPPAKLDITCSRLWSAPRQSCAESHPETPAAHSKPSARRRHQR